MPKCANKSPDYESTNAVFQYRRIGRSPVRQSAVLIIAHVHIHSSQTNTLPCSSCFSPCVINKAVSAAIIIKSKIIKLVLAFKIIIPLKLFLPCPRIVIQIKEKYDLFCVVFIKSRGCG